MLRVTNACKYIYKCIKFQSNIKTQDEGVTKHRQINDGNMKDIFKKKMCLKIRGYFPDSKAKTEETINGKKERRKTCNHENVLLLIIYSLMKHLTLVFVNFQNFN